jgi:ubiquinone/menaquinone biosynthesis C-methylase UbiE
MKTIVVGSGGRISQCQKPRGWLGRFVLWNMNSRHRKVTDWGLGHVRVETRYTILDVGCGGGRTLSKLAAAAAEGRVYGVDYSEESVAASKRTNAHWIAIGRVEIRHASVSQLPFPEGMFDLVTAVETHFWWPNLPAGMREICRVMKPGGQLVVIGEVYKGANTTAAKLVEKHALQVGMTLLDIDEHRALFADAGYSEVQIIEERDKGWICGIGRKPR